MPTRSELESALGQRWAEMAKREGHRAAMPKQFVSSAEYYTDARADTLLRHLQSKQSGSLQSMASRLNTNIDDIRRRMNHLVRRGDARLKEGKYEVTDKTNAQKISDLKTFIARTRRQRDGLAARHGAGVRPSHVSADLAILDSRIEKYGAKIKDLEAK